VKPIWRKCYTADLKFVTLEPRDKEVSVRIPDANRLVAACRELLAVRRKCDGVNGVINAVVTSDT
jgi:hypothetical protein